MSMFKFDFKPESELNTQDKKVILTPGPASFKIIAIFDTKKDGSPLTTMDGTPKITLSLSVKDSAGETGLVYDDLTARTAWKIKALLDALGLAALYDESGQLNPDDLIGGMGACSIKINKSEGYPDRTVVDRYTKAAKQAEIKKDYSTYDDSIPF